MSLNEDGSFLAPIRSDNRLGRSGILVLLVTLATSGAFGGVAYLIRDESASKDVLIPLMLIFGGVGLIWSLVLGVRAAVSRESLLFPFLIALPIFWGFSVPLILTWSEPNRGIDDKWYFLHIFLFPLIIPLGVFALTVSALPVLWLWRKTQRAEESEQSRLRRQTRKTFLVVAMVVFVALWPFGFYLYGGTMTNDPTPWTQSAVAAMPRRIGDIDFFVMTHLPGKRSAQLGERLLERGLVSQSTMIEQIEARMTSGAGHETFLVLAKESPVEALTLARKVMNSSPGPMEDVLPRYFAKHGTAEEVRRFLAPAQFTTLSAKAKTGIILGLSYRTDASDFCGSVEHLMGIDTLSGGLSVVFLAQHANDVDAIRTYLTVVEQNNSEDRNDRLLNRMTDGLLSFKRGAVISAGLNHADPAKRQAVLQSMLVKSLGRPSPRFLDIPECRKAFRQRLESAIPIERVLVALIVISSAEELSPRIRDFYGLSKDQQYIDMKRFNLFSAGTIENQFLIQRARDIVNK